MPMFSGLSVALVACYKHTPVSLAATLYLLSLASASLGVFDVTLGKFPCSQEIVALRHSTADEAAQDRARHTAARLYGLN